MSSLYCSFKFLNVFQLIIISLQIYVLYMSLFLLPEVYIRICLLGWHTPGVTSYFKVNILGILMTNV